MKVLIFFSLLTLFFISCGRTPIVGEIKENNQMKIDSLYHTQYFRGLVREYKNELMIIHYSTKLNEGIGYNNKEIKMADSIFLFKYPKIDKFILNQLKYTLNDLSFM